MTRRRTGGWIFLALVLAACALTAAARPDLAPPMYGSFVSLVARILPALTFVLALMFIAQLLLTRRRIERWLGRGSGARGWLLACSAGVLSTGPVYPWYALLAALHRDGMRTPLIAVFLYARGLKLPLLPLMAHYFGVPYVLIVSLLLVAFAFAGGLVIAAMERRWPLERRPTR